ncbi:DUF1826 domain-containing protein [Vibrio sp. D404a]|uniref:DUF1826 domain-containing protein n=1 Tax=unclassified Vibrio TaxID=2614977 RepID=UPI00255525B8|nr:MULTISPECIES: DUF1826 domain-containing protein [unclassified Vibrio]MDK9736519.1 DUF1826 domain-containing protein [Vibrio sp. D404a]MDK9796828.1 DUF1826 domain-containing protein [Vibrio sp. D449a]
MNSATTEPLATNTGATASKTPSFSTGKQPMVLTDIYQDDFNMVVWERSLSEELINATSDFVSNNPDFSKSVNVSSESAYQELQKSLDDLPPSLVQNIAELVDMFCCLFDLKDAGVRLATLNRAMCPRFHVDRVPCRLVTTFHGTATQWLPNHVLDRSKLGHGSNGQPDHASGLYQDESNIQQLGCGDVALLKGGAWIGNEETALVHRSPMVPEGENRLLLTLDFG